MSQSNQHLVQINLSTLLQLRASASLLNLFQSKIKSRQSGGYVSGFKGRGMEFDEARLYQPGDDIRSIDWRVTARTGKTHTKIFREERERPVFIAVDQRKTMYFATRGVFKSVQAAKLAGLLAWAAQIHGDRVGGQVFTDEKCQEIKPQSGKHGILNFFHLLVQGPKGETKPISLEQALIRLSQHARPGSLVYIISDFRGIDKAGDRQIRRISRHCEIRLIQVYDPLEAKLPQKGRFRFINEQREITLDSQDHAKIKQYQQVFENRLHFLQEQSKKLRLKLITCSTAIDPVEVFQ